MCLDKLTKFKVTPTHADGSVKGWKVFRVKGRSLISQQIGGQLKRKWNIADTTVLIGIYGGPTVKKYNSGYHVFVDCRTLKAFARKKGVRAVPVYFMPKDIITKGEQCDRRCVVVKNMWIEPHDYDEAVGK